MLPGNKGAVWQSCYGFSFAGYEIIPLPIFISYDAISITY